MHRHGTLYVTCACLMLGLFGSCALDDPDTALTDEEARAGDRPAFALTREGVVRGVENGSARVFRGIPYAAPPVGDLRWRPTEPALRRRGVLDATEFRGHCPQGGGAFGQGSTTEDCLFLNVFAPTRRAFDRRPFELLHPVMVWIHGGALQTGESDVFDATRMVEQGDVVVVTINYRLGVLGFMAHPALTAESPDRASGNYGFMDQQEALRWIHRNILFFGGDPSRVTIFGESAGGLSVLTQLVSPGAEDLFHGAIVQSGAYQLTQPPLASVEAAGAAFAMRAGCADQTAACLRGLTVEQVLAAGGNGITGAGTYIDGKVLTQSISTALGSGQFHRVPVIQGANHDEWRLFVAISELTTGPLTAEAYPAAIQATLGIPAALVPVFVAQYPLGNFASPSLALSALGTDGIFNCPARFADQKLSQFVPTFAYEFADPDAPQRFLPPVSFPYGAAHASEIQYVLDLPVPDGAAGFDAAQEDLAEAMVSYWTTFARTGQPNSRDTPAWAPYQAATDTMQSLVPPTPAPTTGYAADHRCAFWDSLPR